MALPPAASNRQLRHRRSIDVTIHSRDDDLWEVDAQVRDVRTSVTAMATGPLAAGEPIHDLLLRLVIDAQFNVLEAGAESRSRPYPGACENHGDAYSQLVGLNLMRGFRHAVMERLGGVRGCTHLTELSQVLPTAVVQAFAGVVVDTRGETGDAQRPFQIDRCHALRADGPVVRAYYPRWYRSAGTNASDPAPRGATSAPDAAELASLSGPNALPLI